MPRKPKTYEEQMAALTLRSLRPRPLKTKIRMKQKLPHGKRREITLEAEQRDFHENTSSVDMVEISTDPADKGVQQVPTKDPEKDIDEDDPMEEPHNMIQNKPSDNNQDEDENNQVYEQDTGDQDDHDNAEQQHRERKINFNEDEDKNGENFFFTPEYTEWTTKLPSRIIETRMDFQNKVAKYNMLKKEKLKKMVTRNREAKMQIMKNLEKMKDRNIKLQQFMTGEDETLNGELKDIARISIRRFELNRMTLDKLEDEEMKMTEDRITFIQEMSKLSKDLARINECYISELIAEDTNEQYEKLYVEGIL